MNLDDLTDEGGLQQDEWSLTAPTFGKERQLAVVGWSGRTKSGTRFYILKCQKCSEDSELFGGGYFRCVKGNLLNSIIPCGCAKAPQWSKDQYIVICSRKTKELGYTFLGFVGEWKDQDTKVKRFCEKHGEWNSGCIRDLINKDAGCPQCGVDSTAAARAKPDDIMIASFFASGGFHPNTKFWRSDRKDSKGYCTSYWHMSCPECGQVGESFGGHLQGGGRSCGCSMHRQQEAYINWLIDHESNPVAIKFGISNNSGLRLKQQHSKSAYTLIQHSVYKFPDVSACKKAERECLQELECGIVLKRDMLDGYTETTWVYNLEKIIEIYKRNGGDLSEKSFT